MEIDMKSVVSSGYDSDNSRYMAHACIVTVLPMDGVLNYLGDCPNQQLADFFGMVLALQDPCLEKPPLNAFPVVEIINKDGLGQIPPAISDTDWALSIHGPFDGAV